MTTYNVNCLSNNFYSNIGLAQRARALLFGEILLNNLSKCYCVLISKDASKKTFDTLMKKCAYYQIDVIIDCDHNLLNQAVGKANIMAVGVKVESFKKLLLK